MYLVPSPSGCFLATRFMPVPRYFMLAGDIENTAVKARRYFFIIWTSAASRFDLHRAKVAISFAILRWLVRLKSDSTNIASGP